MTININVNILFKTHEATIDFIVTQRKICQNTDLSYLNLNSAYAGNGHKLILVKIQIKIAEQPHQEKEMWKHRGISVQKKYIKGGCQRRYNCKKKTIDIEKIDDSENKRKPTKS